MAILLIHYDRMYCGEVESNGREKSGKNRISYERQQKLNGDRAEANLLVSGAPKFRTPNGIVILNSSCALMADRRISTSDV